MEKGTGPQESDPIKKAETEAIKVSLAARVEQQNQILAEIETLFNDVDAFIPQLPPITGGEVTEAHRVAQRGIKECYSRFRDLSRLFTFEKTVPTAGEEMVRAVRALDEVRYQNLQILADRGAMTEDEQMKWYQDQHDRVTRMNENHVRWAGILEAHFEQMSRI